MVTVIPDPEKFTRAPGEKLAPVNAALTLLPADSPPGFICVRITGERVGAVTVKVCAAVVIPPELRFTLRGPAAAVRSIPNWARIWVALDTTTLVTVIPAPETATLAPEVKLVPVSVTGTVVPAVPVAGLRLVREKVAAVTVNVTGELAPTPMLTVTL